MLIPALSAVLLAVQPEANPGQAGEARFLTNPVQLTFAEDFVKAGESYFSHDGKLIVFQGVPVPADGEEPSPHYGMYLALPGALVDRAAEIAGGASNQFYGHVTLVSEEGSANTCGWFHPDEPKLLFGSTVVPPSTENQPGYQRGTGQYRWAFPTEMDIVAAEYDIFQLDRERSDTDSVSSLDLSKSWAFTRIVAGDTTTVFEKPGYTAECSYSPDARHILYANVDEAKSNAAGRPDADLWIYDTETGEHTLIVEAEGYDGGPFFSPDGTWICYRSDRRGDNLLQLFVAELDHDDSGAITGIRREIQLTDNQHVNWAPFFHPSGDFLVYATSEVSHRNYEVFAIAFDDEDPKPTTPVRITYADGFDGLPVFNPDGTKMMWTAQRGDDTRWGGRASSQLWIADFDADAVRDAIAEANSK